MPQVCSVCKSPEKVAVESAILRRVPLSRIAEQTKLSVFAMQRHKKHMPANIVRSAPYEVQQTVQAISLLDRVQSLMLEIRQIAEQAKKNKSWGSALGAMRELRGCIELLGKLSGELQAQTPGPKLSVAVGVNVNSGQQTEHDDGGDANLDARVAECVREATLDFNPDEIARLKAISQQRVFPLLEADSSGRTTGRDISYSQ
jgi:hypothetical protein